jgi:hypothetical protein
MRQNSTVNRKKSSLSRLAVAASNVLEPMEKRVMMSATVAAWNFDSLAIGENLSPAPSSGTGTALTVGLQTSSTNAASPGGVYAYPNPNASGTGDESDILNGSGNEAGGNDNSSTGLTTGSNPTGTNPAWRIRGTSDGWSDSAAVASQGAQFLTRRFLNLGPCGSSRPIHHQRRDQLDRSPDSCGWHRFQQRRIRRHVGADQFNQRESRLR